MRAFGQTLPQQSIMGPTMLAVGPSQKFRFVNSMAEVTKSIVKQECPRVVPQPWRPTWRPSRDNNYVSSCQGLYEAVITRFVASDYLVERCLTSTRCPLSGSGAITYLFDRDVGEIDSYAECCTPIVERELVHETA